MNVETLARQLYDECQTTKPSWDQLGLITKSVWRERAQAQLAPRESAPSTAAATGPEAPEQVDLF